MLDRTGDKGMPRVLNEPAALAAMIAARAEGMTRPFVVALDGRSGAGKSTLARTLADRLDAAIIEGDDFYVGGIALRDDSPRARASACIDWTRQRHVLEVLRTGREAVWQAFDWETFDGRLCDQPTRLVPKPVVIVEGVYAGRPELADRVDLRVVLVVADEARTVRLLAREGVIGRWERQWHEAEDFYFQTIMPPAAFDIIVEFSGA
ncbi:uridine kinase [Bosea sp. RCC_152_1]|uniref:uridine kinase family protein n=1 Tax=Bosea sp. RCC_152_1 TaxID=3239228 RepID=UPI0035255713